MNIATVSLDNSLSNLSTANSIPASVSFEIVEGNSVFSMETSMMQTDTQIMNIDSFNDNILSEDTEVLFEIDLNPSNTKFDYKTTAIPIPVTSQASNSANILNVTNEDDLNSNLYSTIICVEKQESIHSALNNDINGALYINETLSSKLENSPADIGTTETILKHQNNINADNSVNIKIMDPVIIMSTFSEFNNSIEEVLDLSLVSNSTSTVSKETIKNLNTFKDIFTVPTFNGKNKKSKFGNHPSLIVATRDDMLKLLEKKENDKKLKEKQIWENKREKERIKKLREKEQNLYESYQERKKKLIQEKKEINLKIKSIKKNLKSESEKENKNEILIKQKDLCAQLEEIERLLVNHNIENLQQKMKIKQEKI